MPTLALNLHGVPNNKGYPRMDFQLFPLPRQHVTRGVPIWVFGMYQYPILMPLKKLIANNQSDICIIVKSVHLPILRHVHVFIAILCLWWYTAWVSIVQSRQLGTHKHFYVYSHEALNIFLHYSTF